jgi:hypothetical protein
VIVSEPDLFDEEAMEWIHDRFARILLAAADRDAEVVAENIDDVSTRYGHPGVYAVCCGMAETIRTLRFPGYEQGDGSLTGDIAVVQGPADSPDSSGLWATRFVAAYLNGDAATTCALFFGTLENDESGDALVTGVLRLIAMAAVLGPFLEEKEQ